LTRCGCHLPRRFFLSAALMAQTLLPIVLAAKPFFEYIMRRGGLEVVWGWWMHLPLQLLLGVTFACILLALCMLEMLSLRMRRSIRLCVRRMVRLTKIVIGTSVFMLGFFLSSLDLSMVASVVLAAAIGAPCTTMWKNINVDTEVNAEMDNPTCDLGELSLNLRPPSFPLISYALMTMVDEFCKQLPDDLWNNFTLTVKKAVTIKSLAQGIVERCSLWIQSCGVPNALGPQNMVANQRLQDLIDEMDDLKNKLSKFGEKYLKNLRDKFESVVIKLEQLKEKQEVFV